MHEGTPAYMAPEQTVGDATDARTDLYALGIILYELITGRRPFAGKSLLVLVQEHLSTPPPPMSETAPQVQVPKAVEDLVLRLLAKNPDDRVQHPQELLDAIDQIVAAHKLAWTPSGAAPAAAAGDSGSALLAPAAGPSGSSGAAGAADGEKSASGIRRALGSAPGSAAASAAPYPRPVQRLLAQLRAPLPEPLQRVPRWQALAAGLVLAAALPLGLGLKGRKNPKSSIVADRPAPPGTKAVRPPPVATQASAAAIDAAVAQGPAALATLLQRFPDDPRVLRAQIRSLIGQHRPVEAMRTVAKLATLDPNTGRDPEIAQALVAALQSDEESAQAANKLLEEDLGEAGVELLYDLTVKQTGARWKPRLNQSLTKPQVLRHATPALRVAIDLRAARRCEAKRDLLPRVKSEGDRRALMLLRGLTQNKGCGFLGLADCWPCLRKSPALAEAIATLEARSPAAAGSAAPAEPH